MDQMMKLLKNPWLFLGVTITGMAVLLYQGFVLSYLWLWFVAPFGLPRIDLAWACGIMLVARTLTQSATTSPFQPIIMIGEYMLKKHNDGEVERFPRELLNKLRSEVGSQFFIDLTKPLWFLLFGAIFHRFM